MVMAPVRQPQGGQEESSAGGLILHRGPLNAAVIRAIGSPATNQPVLPRDGYGSGSGLELIHAPHAYSQVQSYDRDTATWLDLAVFGKNINLSPQGGGKLTLPAGSVQATIGNRWIGAWNTPAATAWYETPVQQNLSVTAGNVVRVEACGSVTHTVATAILYIGLGIDGGIVSDSMTIFQPAIANQNGGYAIVGYFSGAQIPTTGNHRFSLFLYSSSGVGGLFSGAYQYLYVTEQRA